MAVLLPEFLFVCDWVAFDHVLQQRELPVQDLRHSWRLLSRCVEWTGKGGRRHNTGQNTLTVQHLPSQLIRALTPEKYGGGGGRGSDGPVQMMQVSQVQPGMLGRAAHV